MALTKTDISKLYTAIFNRASEGNGNTYWQTQGDMVEVANKMLATPDAKAYFGDALDDDKAFVEWIYKNTFNKTYADDPSGIDHWVQDLANGASRGEVVANIVNAATDPANAGAAQDQFMNRVAVSDYTADTIADVPSHYKELLGFDDMLKVTNDPATVEAAKNTVNLFQNKAVLTNDTDIVTAGLFEAPMVYTPDGSDRILSLQDEDQLTGLGDNSVLNATLGNRNADEGTTGTVTPTLNNVANIIVDWTGNTNTLDLRYSNGTKSIHIDKLTSDAGAVTVNNIGSYVDDLKVANAADVASSATFTYETNVLDGTNDKLNLELDHILANSVTQNSNLNTEGFEHVTVNASNGVYLASLNINELQDIALKGTGDFNIVTLAPTTPLGATAPEFDSVIVGGGINAPGSAGIRDIDGSDFAGDISLDITNAMGRNVDPNNSGAPFYGTVEGGKGDDKFYTTAAIAGNNAADGPNGHNVIDGGDGENTLVSTVGNIANDVVVKNVQTLELRDQDGVAGYGAVDMDAFDSALSSIVMRGEDTSGTATTFTLNDLTATQAEEALTLKHSITGAGAQTVVANLKDASGSDDTVALTVENDKNTGNTFNYTLTAGGTTAATTVENVTLHDKDTESNIVTLTNNAQHTGTLKIDGGSAGTTFTVANIINSAVVDASDDVSDLRLTVGDVVAPIAPITQDVKLGSGDDVLTFANIDEFDSTDKLSDAGGNDTVRAAFSQDANLDIDGIENLQVTATANVKLGMGSANVDNLVILSNTAVDNTGGAADLDANGVQEPFGITASNPTNIITIDQSALTQLNFFADNDTNDATTAADDVTAHTFNGVKLENNTASDITVNINSSLDTVVEGSTSYTIGQITSHGNTSMNIVVGDEDQETTITAATTRSAGNGTFINNIYAKNMETLTATAYGNLTLGTVSGGPLNNTLKTFDMTNVGGDVSATIISLGDNAEVKLADGNNNVSALGSAGKNVHMTAGNGNNTLTGTAQDDVITTGSGWDTIAGDRGDNVITTGAGNDTVTAKEGNDTVDLGTGIDSYADNLGSGFNGTTATNTVSKSGGVAQVSIDVDGNGAIVAGTDVDQMIAVGEGSDLTISWTGATINATTAVLDGRLAQTFAADGAAGTNVTADGNANLAILTTGGVETVAASAGNDVTIFTGSVAGTDGLDFSGGAGNDAAVGTLSVDSFNGGVGADVFVMQDTAALDTNTDRVVIADGDSTASAWDIIHGFDYAGGVAGNLTAAVGSATAGDDVLDLDSTLIAGVADSTALTSNITIANGTIVDDVAINANGLATFEDNSVVGVGGTAVQVGTADNEISLEDALAALATELNGTLKTVVFLYDADGDGAFTANDSTFVFQDGASDTVIELTGIATATGLEAVGGGTANLIEIG